MKKLFLPSALICFFLCTCQLINIDGRIINEGGSPIRGASIAIKHTNKTTISNAEGTFTIHNSQLTDTLVITAVGYESAEIPNNERGLLTIILKHPANLLPR